MCRCRADRHGYDPCVGGGSRTGGRDGRARGVARERASAAPTPTGLPRSPAVRGTGGVDCTGCVLVWGGGRERWLRGLQKAEGEAPKRARRPPAPSLAVVSSRRQRDDGLDPRGKLDSRQIVPHVVVARVV